MLMYNKDILIREEEACRLNAILNKIEDLETDSNSDKNQALIDTVIGREPVYKHLSSLRNKQKSNGEILLSKTDWQEFIEKLQSGMKSMPPLDNYLTDTSIEMHWSAEGAEEKLLRRILEMLKYIHALLLEIMRILTRGTTLQKKE